MRVFVIFLLAAFSLVALPTGEGVAAIPGQKVVIPFEGVLDMKAGQYEARFGGPDAPSVKITVARPQPGKYHLTADIKHVPARVCDVAAVVEGDLSVTGTSPERREFSGKITSAYTLLNYKPVRDLNIDFAVKERRLQINSFWLGSLSGRGTVDLTGERRVAMAFELLPVDIEEAVSLFSLTDTYAASFSGTAAASVMLTGALRKPEIKGRISFYNGRLKALAYDSILLQLDGTYPVLRLVDSSVTQGGTGFTFKLGGILDLASLDRLPEQVGQLQKEPIVELPGRNKREWVLKRIGDGDSVTELKYLLLKDDRGDTEGVLGFEKKIGF